jgi:two-component system, chemotaxis family, CheB/CheR fusion protein
MPTPAQVTGSWTRRSASCGVHVQPQWRTNATQLPGFDMRSNELEAAHSVAEEQPTKLSLVGIGASAGGIQALREFFAEVPERTGLVYVVVMHLAPDRVSNLAEVLQVKLALPVQQVQGRLRMEPDHVYVIPPGRSLQVADGYLDLADFSAPRGRRAPIDVFFRTMAEASGNTVGVLLSGSGMDGVVGLAAIKERGGVIMAQDPGEAEYDTMPRAAIATGLVDFILPARRLGAKVVELGSSRSPWLSLVRGDSQATSGDELRRLLGHLRARTGHDLTGFRQDLLLRRVARRMHVNQIDNLAGYLEHVRSSDRESQALLDDLLVSVTCFFRDQDSFEALGRSIIPGLFEGRTGEDTLRIWVAGCATGEEAYSVAMLLHEHASLLQDPPRIQLFATDLNSRSIAFAREGRYPSAIAADVSPDRLGRFFTADGPYCRVRSELRDAVLFAPHDLLHDPPYSRMDLILCRNLLGSLEPGMQKRVLRLFSYATREDGYLFLGRDETADSAEAFFVLTDGEHSFYRRTSRAVRAAEPLTRSATQAPPMASGGSRARLQTARVVTEATAREEADEALHLQAAARHTPPSVLVDGTQRILHVTDSAQRYLHFPAGTPTPEVLRVARPELRQALRTGLEQASVRHEASCPAPLELRIDGARRLVQLHISPADVQGASGALIVFLESAAPDAMAPTIDSDLELEHTYSELADLRDALREVVAESDTRFEELQASNEELQSINEEYKATLDQLETSQEELQSVNEELRSVNDELSAKVREVSRTSSDLVNLMAATDIGTLFLDRQLRIRRFTPALSRIFNIMAVDEGRPAAHVTHNLEYDELLTDCEAVLQTLRPLAREVCDGDGHHYLMRITVYRTEDDAVAGVVITFTDISASRRAQAELRRREQLFRVLVDATAQIVWSADATGVITEDSPSWRAFTGQAEHDWLGDGWLDMVHPDDREAASACWESALTAGTAATGGFRLFHQLSGKWRDMEVRAVPVAGPDGRVLSWVGMNTDVTEARAAQQALVRAKQEAEASNTAKSQFLSVLSHELRTPLTAVIGSADLLGSGALGELTEAQQLQLRRMKASSWHLVAIIDEMLAYTRSEAGKDSLHLDSVNAAAVARDVAAMLEMQAAERGVELQLQGAEQPSMLFTDAGKLRQIIANLIGNAVKFTRDGSVRIDVSAQGDDLLLAVTDTGIGIDARQLEKIFDPFYQVDSSNTRTAGGTGLGLAVSRRLARVLGGDIEVTSTPGEGSTFSLRVPRQPSDPTRTLIRGR